MAPVVPRFMIVGTPRSGTTLVQRLLCDVPGIAVPPETHFFTDVVPEVARRSGFPLGGADLVDVVEWYCGRGYVDGTGLRAGEVLSHLGGRPATAVDLFGAILAALGGTSPIVGEKTPGHLRWWRPISTLLPELRFVIVVRDPRAVVASFAQLGWGGRPALTAYRWRVDARLAMEARAVLRDRAVVVRYEDVVGAPDATTQELVAYLELDARADVGDRASADALFAPFEVWKADALGPVDPGRAQTWRQRLARRDVAAVEAVCRREMLTLGYVPEHHAALRAGLAACAPRRLRRAWMHRRERRSIDRLATRLR